MYTLLDAAAYVPHAALDLTETPFDFVAISFYKMFGYPTGLGALIVRHDAGAPSPLALWLSLFHPFARSHSHSITLLSLSFHSQHPTEAILWRWVCLSLSLS